MIFFIRASKLVTFVKTFFGALSTTSFHCFFFPQLKQKRQRQNLVGFCRIGKKMANDISLKKRKGDPKEKKGKEDGSRQSTRRTKARKNISF
jgi:hypothetical protein